MLISHEKRFIFLKTKKTAGTSVEMYFQNYCVSPKARTQSGETIPTQTECLVSKYGVVGYRGPRNSSEPLYNHMSALEVRDYNPKVFDTYFKFTVIRNPFDKVVSFFWHRNKNRDDLKNPTFDKVRSEFRKWLLKSGVRPRDREVYSINGKFIADYFIRSENLVAGLEHVCEHLGVKFEPERLGTFKSGFRAVSQPYQDYYDDETRKMVSAFFLPEIQYFGYNFQDENCASSEFLGPDAA